MASAEARERARARLLTLIENESVPLTLPEWAGGETLNVDSSGLLFVCGGAFEGLYDAVYDRVTVGRDRGALQPVTVVEGGEVREVIVATDPTVEGETTAMYLVRRLQPLGVEVSRPASGIPVGGELAAVDQLTLAQALQLRRKV